MKLKMIIGKYYFKMISDGHFVSGIAFSSVTGRYGLSGNLLIDHFFGKEPRRIRRLLKLCSGVF